MKLFHSNQFVKRLTAKHFCIWVNYEPCVALKITLETQQGFHHNCCFGEVLFIGKIDENHLMRTMSCRYRNWDADLGRSDLLLKGNKKRRCFSML